MKNIIKNIIFSLIFIFFMLIINLNIKALDGTKSTFDNKINTINTFYNVFNDYNDTYLISGPFVCLLSNNKIKCTGNANSSSISKLEYEIIGSNSYLTSKESYWLNDSKDTNIAYTVDKKINEVTKFSLNSSRASVYVQDHITYSGSGTRIDPFTLNESNKSQINASGDINLLAFYIDSNDDGIFSEEEKESTIKASNDYEYDHATCVDINGTAIEMESNRVTFKNSNKSVTITNVTEYISCIIYLKDITNLLEKHINFDKIATTMSSIIVGNNDTSSFAIDSTGKLWGWGYSSNSAVLGSNYKSTPVNLVSSKTFLSVFAGVDFVLAIDTSKKLWGWGNNSNGIVSTSSSTSIEQPYNIMPNKKFLTVCAGEGHVAALDTSGDLWVWGWNYYNQLGTGDTNNRPLSGGAYQIFAGTGKYIDVACGVRNTYAIDTENNLWSWGINGWGQLGLNYNSSTNISTPTQAWSTLKFSKIAAGEYHALGITTDGKLKSWGTNMSGQLGINSYVNMSNAICDISNSNNFVDIDAAMSTSYAIDTNGNLYRWGSNTAGNLANNTTKNIIIPTILEGSLIINSNNVSSVAIDSNWAIYSAGKGANMGIGESTSTFMNLIRVHTIPDIDGNN